MKMGTFWSNVRGKMTIFLHGDRNGGGDSSSSSESDSNYPGGDECPHIDYDTGLPVTHNYLGDNLDEMRGRTVLDDLSYQVLPLLPQPGVVLMPGQTLPLMIFYPPTISMLRNLTTTNGTFGVVCVRQFEAHHPRMAAFGTTAEIYEYCDEREVSGFRVKAKGRQRFQIVDSRRTVDGNLAATVKILPEITLVDSLYEMRLLSLDHHRSEPSDLQRPLTYISQNRLQRKQLLSRRDAMMTPFPQWVHSLYNANSLAYHIKSQLGYLTLGTSSIKTSIPTDPVELSFWVAQNMPFQDDQKLSLLKVNSSIQRLRWELRVLERCQMLCCRVCETQIADPKETFSMSVEGPQGTYVNPGGFVHETLTVHRAKGLKCVNDQPSTEHSWFPGYAWTIAECRYCKRHMGWKFTATNRTLKPQKFWGICRRSIVTKLLQEDEIVPNL